MACWVEPTLLQYVTVQTCIDLIIWLWAHFLIVILFLELRSVWFSVRAKPFLDVFFGFIPFSLLIVNVTVPLLLISLSGFFKADAMWRWYFQSIYKIPIFGELHLLERYFNLFIYQGAV
ncbi:MAG: hypothetical protein CML20_18350 [Rheinheimera sp.]|nr:hypothetical protein [Rheinheimera sp.]